MIRFFPFPVVALLAEPRAAQAVAYVDQFAMGAGDDSRRTDASSDPRAYRIGVGPP